MVVALLMAAGSGRRLRTGEEKACVDLMGRPLFLYSLCVLEECPLVDSVILVASPRRIGKCRAILEEHSFSKSVKVVEGGDRRQDSVLNGLAALPSDADVVLVHDAARPFVTSAMVRTVIDSLRGWDGVIVALPARDTVKVADGEQVQETLDRDRVWMAQTPQAFYADVLKDAHLAAEKSGFLATDDASLVEWRGYKVRVILGDETNIKITTAQDLIISETLLRHREDRSQSTREDEDQGCE